MRRHRNLFSLFFSLPWLLAATDAQSDQLAKNVPEPFLKLSEKGLTLKAHDVPLDRILVRIAELYGTSITLEGKLATPVTLSFRGLSLQDAIRRLVGEAAVMILHEPPSSHGVAARPSKIWVYASAQGQRNVADSGSSKGIDEPQSKMDSASDAPPTAEEPAPRDATQAEIEAMAERRTPGDLDALGAVVSEHLAVQMRYLAVTLLGDIPEDRAVLAIERGLGDEDPLFRSYVVETLGTNHALDAVRSLGYVVYGEPDPSVRLLAVSSLAIRAEGPAREFLADAARDPDPAVRRAAANALRGYR